MEVKKAAAVTVTFVLTAYLVYKYATSDKLVPTLKQCSNRQYPANVDQSLVNSRVSALRTVLTKTIIVADTARCNLLDEISKMNDDMITAIAIKYCKTYKQTLYQGLSDLRYNGCWFAEPEVVLMDKLVELNLS